MASILKDVRSLLVKDFSTSESNATFDRLCYFQTYKILESKTKYGFKNGW